MLQFKMSKKATTTIAITLIAVFLATGAITAGTIIARNHINSNSISYQEAIDIASAIPDVAEFIELHEITSVYAQKMDTYWIVEFYADNYNYSSNLYCWINYAYVEIDATTGEVLYYIVYTNQDPNFTEDEIIQIANSIPEIAEWLLEQGAVDIYAWYDGYEYWYVDYYTMYGAYAYVCISNIDGSVIYYEIFEDYYGPIHTEEEIITLVEALPEVIDWIAENPIFERYIWFYDIIWFEDNNTDYRESYPGNTTNGYWAVDYIACYENDTEWLSINVDDLTLEILAIYEDYDPTKTEEEIITIALAIPEVNAFINNLTTYTIFTYFDSFSRYWTVIIQNELNYCEYAYIYIDDLTGEVTYLFINDLPDPLMTVEEVLIIAYAQPEVQDFIANVTDYVQSIGFCEGLWYVNFYPNITYYNQTNGTEYTFGLCVVIDDATGEVVEIIYIYGKID